MIDMNNINDNTEPVEVNSCLNSNHTTSQWETGFVAVSNRIFENGFIGSKYPFRNNR